MNTILARPRSRDAIALASLALLWLLLSWRLLPFLAAPADRLQLANGDFWQHFYVYRSFAFDELRAGRLPLWMSCVFSGYPYHADPQAALFYPSTLLNLGLWLALGAAALPREAFQLEALLHLLLGAWLMYFFLRGTVRRRAAALIGAIVWGFGGYLTSYPLLQLAILESAVWLPLVLLLIRRLARYGNWRDAIWLGLVWALALLAGHGQTALYVFYLGAAYFVWMLAAARVSRAVLVQRVALGLAALAAAASVAAIQLLPTLEYTARSTRADLGYDAASSGFPPQDVLQFILPGFVSAWQPLYAGLLPLLLAGYALWAWRRGRSPVEVWFWLGVGVVGLLLSFGKAVLGFDLAYLLLPGYRLFRGQERHALWVALALAVLAAYGADRWLGPLSRRDRIGARGLGRALGAGVVLLFVTLAVVTYLARLGHDPSDRGRLPAFVGLAFLVATMAAALWAARLRGLPLRTVAVLAVALVAFDLLSASHDFNLEPPGPIYPPEPLLEPLPAGGAGPPIRIQHDGVLAMNIACSRGLSDIGGSSPLRPAAYMRFLNQAPQALRWKLLNVRYVVSWRAALKGPDGAVVASEPLAEREAGGATWRTFQLPGPDRPAWLVHDVQPLLDETRLQAALAEAGFDPFQTAIVEGEPPVAAAPAGASEAAQVTSWRPGRYELEVAAAAPALVVVSEPAYPGWAATVDGAPAAVHLVDGVVLGVAVPAGTHRVVLEYRSWTLVAGAALSLASLLGAATALAVRRGRSLPGPALAHG